MNYNYNSLLDRMMPRKKMRSKDGPLTRGNGLISLQKFCAVAVFSLFGAAGMKAQTTLIDPAGAGGFNLGNTFQANGWTVANEGTGSVKWAVGKAAAGFTATANSVTGTSVTLSASNVNIVAGQVVYGINIPANTYVSSVVGTAVTLSQAATANTTTATTLGFGYAPGSVSVATSATIASVAVQTYSITLPAANANISVGMLITDSSGVIAANTYVASVSGTTVGLSQPTTNTAVQSNVVLSFGATTSAISDNAAYITNDGGTSYSYLGSPLARTVYFYRDIMNVPFSQKAMTLTFDVKSDPSSSSGWQVWVAPITQSVTGTDSQPTNAFTYNPTWPGADPKAVLISFNTGTQVSVTKNTAFIPPSFAGTSFRLIFVWTNTSSTSATSGAPAAIDNISLVSRVPITTDITCAHSGLWSQPTTWTNGIVPTPGDIGVVKIDSDNEQVIINSRYSGCQNLSLTGTNSLLQFASSTVIDEFSVFNDLQITGSGAIFNNHDGAKGKRLKVGHDITVGTSTSVARLDSSINSTTQYEGMLTLNGTKLQTITVDPSSFMGGVASVTKNSSGNRGFVLNQLEVTNTSPAIPNVSWKANGVRIHGGLWLTSGRVQIASGNKLILGNFGAMNKITCPTGYGFTSGAVSKWMANVVNTVVQPGGEYPGADTNNSVYAWYPFVSGKALDRSLYLMSDASPTAGEVVVTYNAAETVTGGLSISDGNYTINNRYDGNWSFSVPDSRVDTSTGTAISYTPNVTTSTHKVGVYDNGAFLALDGTTRLMNENAALPGTIIHQDGTPQFAISKGFTINDLTNLPLYVGIANASVLNSSSGFTSAITGDWNDPLTWNNNGKVPGCNDVVTIASGNVVTVTTAASAAGVIINQGGTLVNNSGSNTMTVGCVSNNTNNAPFNNYGTHTVISGNLAVNGFMDHKTGSFFNQSGGEIIIDSNNNGDANTSVASGGSSCKIETANLVLTGGKITIVDPLINNGAAIAKTAAGDFTVSTAKSQYMTCYNSVAVASGNPVVRLDMTPNQDGSLPVSYLYVGQPVICGTAGVIQPGTTVLSWVQAGAANNYDVTLSLAPTGALASYGAANAGLKFKYSDTITDAEFVMPTKAAVAAGATTVIINTGGFGSGAPFFVGQPVSGLNIPAGTVISAVGSSSGNASLTLSNATTGAILRGGNLSFISMVNGASSIALGPDTTANNALILKGFLVSGDGIPAGTTVTGVGTGNGITRIDLSSPVTGLNPSPITSQKTITISPSVAGANGTVLTAADANLQSGMPVAGIGIKPGTFITAVSGTSISFSEPIQAGAPNPLVFTAYPDTTVTSGAFVYSGSGNYAAGLNHTLQIGDGISTQRGADVTNGFNCVFQNTGGMISLGNLIVNAPDGANRFMRTSNLGTNGAWGALNVQNQLTIASGSTLQKVNGNISYYLGGNIVNNGSFLQPSASGALYLGNFLNGVATATTLPQTISGNGVWRNDQYHANPASPTGSIPGLTVNNTSVQGVTLSVPNFRSIGTVTMTSGILHTSAAFPMYVGVADVTSVQSATSFKGGNAISYIDGPCVFANPAASATGPIAITTFNLFPTGKNGKFLPIYIASTGGVELMAEAFDANTGTVNAANGSSLSSNRWVVTRVGALGTFTGYNVKLGANDMSSTKIIVHAPGDQGVYDVVSNPISTTTFAAPNSTYTINNITLTTAQTTGVNGGFTGNFSYAESLATCTGTPAPGNTVASSSAIYNGQSVTLSLQNKTIGNGVTYLWSSSADGVTYTPIVGANSATYTAFPTANTSYKCTVTCSTSSKDSEAIRVSITTSAALIVNNPSVCTAGTVNLTATGGTSVNWYDAPTGGNLVQTANNSFSPFVSQTTTYYAVDAGSVTQGTDTNINAPITFPGTTTSSTLNSGVVFDASNNLLLKKVTVYPKNTSALTPITVGLFDSTGKVVSGTSLVSFLPTLNTSTIGSVSQDVTLNYRVPVGIGYRLLVVGGLAATTNLLGTTTTGAISYPSTSGVLTLQGNVASLNGAAVATANATTYFFNLTYAALYEPRVPGVATVVNTPAPTAAAVQSACTTGTIADFAVTSVQGATLKYYDASNNSILSSAPAVANTTYYISQTVNNCEGPKTAVTAYSITDPIVAARQSACATGTIADFVVTGANGASFVWYDALNNIIPTSTPVVVNTTYYVAQQMGTCISNKAGVTALGANIVPNAASSQSACATGTIADFVVTGANGADIIWYDASNTVIPTTTPVVVNTVYYVAQQNGTCLSNKVSVTATGIKTSAPTASAEQKACATGTIADFVVDTLEGATVTWYDSSNTVIPTSTLVTVNGVYYVTQTANGCESTKIVVTATGIKTSAPTASAEQKACATGTIADFEVTTLEGATITWYDASNTIVPTSTSVTVNGVYYVTQTANGCESTKTLITATGIKTSAPTGEATQDSCNTGTIADFTVLGGNGASFTWYNTSMTVIPTTTEVVEGTTYYVTQTIDGCESDKLAILASGPCLGVDGLEIADLRYYPNPVSDRLMITANDVITKVELYNLLGQQLRTVDHNADAVQIDFSEYAPSTYLVKVYSENKVQYFKVIKK